MFKKEFGISIYPEKTNLDTIKTYLSTAKKYGFTRLFLSWLQIKEVKKYKAIYRKTIKMAKKLGYYVVLDIADNNFKFYQSLNVDCLRLDSPLLPKEVADITYETDLDIQLNMSNNDNFINNVFDYEPVKENIYGCHNFYPQNFTGLGWDFFEKSTKRFNDLGIHTSAFINSKYGTDGPQNFKLVNGTTTVEQLRNKPIRSQAKYLLATKQIDAIYIGNQFASTEELAEISTINTKIVELDIKLSNNLSPLELKILNDIDHFSRGDINETFIRSTMSRVIYQGHENIKPRKQENINNKLINLGNVYIINSNNLNYQKELIIVINENDWKFNNQDEINYIGTIAQYDLDLLKLIKPWQHFKFRSINN